MLAKRSAASNAGSTPKAGGAPLLGFNGVVMKAHGSARERAIASAIRVTCEILQHRVHQSIAEGIARANERLAATQASPPAAAVSED